MKLKTLLYCIAGLLAMIFAMLMIYGYYAVLYLQNILAYLPLLAF